MANEAADPLAALLLEHSVKTGEFVLASGERSDVYVDVRKTSLIGRGALLIGQRLHQLGRKFAPDATGVGGLTLGADPVVTAICCAAAQAGDDWGGVLVRKKAKSHGTQGWLEFAGNLSETDELLVVDDVITTAGSTIKAIERLRDFGFVIRHALCVVDRLAGGREALSGVNVELHSLFTIEELTR